MNAFLDRVVEFSQNGILQRGHFLPFGLQGVIHTRQVQNTMHKQHLKLRHQIQFAEICLPFCGFKGDQDIPKIAFTTFGICKGVLEGEDIRNFVNTAILKVEFLDCMVIIAWRVTSGSVSNPKNERQ